MRRIGRRKDIAGWERRQCSGSSVAVQAELTIQYLRMYMLSTKCFDSSSLYRYAITTSQLSNFNKSSPECMDLTLWTKWTGTIEIKRRVRNWPKLLIPRCLLGNCCTMK